MLITGHARSAYHENKTFGIAELPQVLLCLYGFTTFHTCQSITFITALTINHCSTLLHHATQCQCQSRIHS